ncbi:unnamed protein product [Lepeophtheirus salmonis]|uniref:(salmon louse) hypothetical protein n=1 Tax=Lepeophtheirus salmonis TaxID=72036 RepID=A0A7R8H8R6_LEPSM|nr:unnamed protein product [Lepeophtheirus salmonis]CAF2943124.1 unnamed protein product [Lepeophtheirus salmonis]
MQILEHAWPTHYLTASEYRNLLLIGDPHQIPIYQGLGLQLEQPHYSMEDSCLKIDALQISLHPQSEGSFERANDYFKGMLVALMKNNNTPDWRISFQFVHQHHTGINLSLFKAMFEEDP